MSLVRRNIIANLVGGAWIAALTIAITPLQVNLLGIEAYGVVAFISTLQIAFTAFDLGLASTLTRELAADPTPGKTGSDGLMRTAGTIYWASAVVIGIALASAAGPIAAHWFKVGSLGTATIEQSVRVIALYLALRWPVAMYAGLLAGLQRMDILNGVKAAAASLRLAGGILVLLQWHSLEAFLGWTALSAVIEVIAYVIVCRRVHPTMPLGGAISRDTIRRVWRFSASMNVLTLLAVFIVQLDRLLISKMLPLEALGYYNLAYTAASTVAFVVGAIGSAALPSFAAVQGRSAPGELLERYRVADRAMLSLVGVVAFALLFHGKLILGWWINPAAAAAAQTSLALLVVGFWIGAAINNVYNVAVACGVPGRHLRVNILTIAPYAAVMYFLIGRYGATGAALAWVLLNLAYAVLLVPAIHHRVLQTSTRRWLLRTVLPFIVLGVASFGVPALIAESVSIYAGRIGQAVALCVGVLVYGVATFLLFMARPTDAASLRMLLTRPRARGDAQRATSTNPDREQQGTTI